MPHQVLMCDHHCHCTLTPSTVRSLTTVEGVLACVKDFADQHQIEFSRNRFNKAPPVGQCTPLTLI